MAASRSVFELVESGKSDDQVQSFIFHAEGFLLQSSPLNRAASIKKIFEICSQTSTSSLFDNGVVVRNIFDILRCYCDEKDQTLRFWISAIAATLLIDPQTPSDVHKSSKIWLHLIFLMINICSEIPKAMHTKTVEVDTPPDKSKFHHKRKFRSPSKDSHAPRSPQSRDSPPQSLPAGFGAKRKFSSVYSSTEVKVISPQAPSPQHHSDSVVVSISSAVMWKDMNSIFSSEEAATPSGSDHTVVSFRHSQETAVLLLALNHAIQSLVRNAVSREDPTEEGPDKDQDKEPSTDINHTSTPREAYTILIHRIRQSGLLSSVCSAFVEVVRRRFLLPHCGEVSVE
jgi:hypothetical protein